MKKITHYLAIASTLAILFFSSFSVKAADIVDTASQSDQFKTLVAALKAGGLVETLKSKGPFTVFAPTDEAFAKLPAGTVESLLLPENKSKLVMILSYHVIPGKVVSTDLAGKIVKPKTVEGNKLTVNGKNGGVRVNKATVTKADISTDNGVIHVIDQVLLPPEHGHQKSHKNSRKHHHHYH